MKAVPFNPADYLILAVILILFVLAFWYAWCHKHESCGGGSCSDCPYHEKCKRKKKK